MNFSSYFREWFVNPRVEIFSGIVVAPALIPEAMGFSFDRRRRPENRFIICLGRHRLRHRVYRRTVRRPAMLIADLLKVGRHQIADHRLIVMGDDGCGTSPVAAVSKTP